MALAKPTSPVFQRDHPLARNLALGWPLSENAGKSAYDQSVNGYNGVFDGSWNGGISGAAVHTDGSSTQVVLVKISGQVFPNIQAGDFTIALGFILSTLGSYTPIFDGHDSTNGRIYSLFLNAGGGASTVFWANGGAGSGGTDNINIGQSIAANVQYDLTITRKGTLSSFYIGGKLGGTDSSQTGTTANTNTTRTFSIGGNPSSGGAKQPTTYNYLALWNRALSATEVAQFVSDPFAIYRQRSRWWEVPAAAGAFTNRPGPRMGPALPFGLAIAGAKLLERNPIMRRRELFRWDNRGEIDGICKESDIQEC